LEKELAALLTKEHRSTGEERRMKELMGVLAGQSASSRE